MSQKTWVKRAEGFAKIRAQIRQVLATSDKPMDIAQITTQFKLRFRFLPSIERRLRELVESGAIKRIGGDVPKYELVT